MYFLISNKNYNKMTSERYSTLLRIHNCNRDLLPKDSIYNSISVSPELKKAIKTRQLGNIVPQQIVNLYERHFYRELSEKALLEYIENADLNALRQIAKDETIPEKANEAAQRKLQDPTYPGYRHRIKRKSDPEEDFPFGGRTPFLPGRPHFPSGQELASWRKESEERREKYFHRLIKIIEG